MSQKFIKKKLLKLIEKHNDYSLYCDSLRDDETDEDLLIFQNNRIKRDLCFLQIQYLKQLLK